MTTAKTGPQPFSEFPRMTQDQTEQKEQLIRTRSKDGDILGIHPELYWDAIYKGFRAYGKEPHHMRQAPS